MRAGLLRERVIFQKQIEKQSPSGSISTLYVNVLTTKAYKKRNTFYGNEVNAKESFAEAAVVIQVRYHSAIETCTRVIYRKQPYRITHIDFLIQDKTVLVTMRKVNE